MTTTIEKPGIQCKYRDHQDKQCPLDAEPSSDYCRFHPMGRPR